MPSQQNKITTRQLIVLFILVTLSPAIRLFPEICSKLGGMAGWTAPIIATAGLLILLAVLNAFFKKGQAQDFCAVIENSLGKPAGKVLIVIYMIWLILLYFLYIRYYADRLLASIYPNTNIRFFLIVILIPVFIALRGKIESLARFGEFSFIMFTIVFILFYVLLAASVKISNLLPLTYYDIWPAAKAGYIVLAIWSYVVLLFFLGDDVIKKEELMMRGRRAALYLGVMMTLMMIFIVGSLGYKLAERMPLPFFGATKLISFIESFDRLEPVLLSAWVVSDFIVISVFGLVIMNIAKKLFNAAEKKYFAFPVVLLGYAGSLFLCTSLFELETFSSKFALHANVVMFFLVPIAVLAIGKLRGKV